MIDFSRAAIDDVAWWRRSNAMIRQMARDDEIAGLKSLFEFQCALVANGSLTKESFDTSQEAAKELYLEIIRAIQPWNQTDKKSTRSSQIEQLMDAYKKYVGDPDDPVFQAKLIKQRERQKAQEAGLIESPVVMETEDERITRLIRERDAQQAERIRNAIS